MPTGVNTKVTKAKPKATGNASWTSSTLVTFVFAVRCLPGTAALQCCTSKPTIDADIRLAMVPASMARKPSFANSERLFGASAPMPPI